MVENRVSEKSCGKTLRVVSVPTATQTQLLMSNPIEKLGAVLREFELYVVAEVLRDPRVLANGRAKDDVGTSQVFR